MNSVRFENVVSTREIFQGRIISLSVKDVVLPSGRTTTREIVQHPGAVVIVATDFEGRVAMVRQYRSAIGRVLLELPAGTRDRDETAVDCARRELREEMGVSGSRWFPLIEFYSAPGFCTETLSVFVAVDLQPTPDKPEDDELIDRLWVPRDSVVSQIVKGDIVDAKTIAGVLAFLEIDRSGTAPWRA